MHPNQLDYSGVNVVKVFDWNLLEGIRCKPRKREVDVVRCGVSSPLAGQCSTEGEEEEARVQDP